jgi:tetratricopeptide (TPR) repeat protein
MKPPPTSGNVPGGGFRRSAFMLVAVGVVLVLILGGFLLKRSGKERLEDAAPNPSITTDKMVATDSPRLRRGASLRSEAETEGKETGQEIVARKVIQFSKNRRDLLYAMAKQLKVEVPDDVERFFQAVESGRWEEIDAAHRALLQDEKQLNQPRSAELHQIWRPIQETWGAAREAHNWPSQKLLDYGNAILDSLRPGMVYAGGTDPGCFIATMLNETSDAERHIMLTQNALADNTYLNYLSFQYGDRMAALTEQDSQSAFQQYISDAQKRLQHDQQFPNEPKQIKPGEDVRLDENGAVKVSGQIAVMAINEKLFQMLMGKNPDVSFAMEESFPFSSLYGTAAPLGPVMEMRVEDGQLSFTAERAAQSVDYWRAAVQSLVSDPDIPQASDARKAYAKLISSQAGLLQDHKFTAQAEQAFRLATEVCPSSPEAVYRLINLLTTQGRTAEALPVAENAVRAAPDQPQFKSLLAQLRTAR